MLKKYLSLIGISFLLGSGVASADCCNACCPCFTPHLYVEGYVGYAFNDWKTSLDDAFQPLTPVEEGTTIITHNKVHHRDGFAGGGDIGYQFNPYFAIEFGGFGCQKTHYEVFTQSITETDEQSSRSKGSITNWFLYSAVRMDWTPKWICNLDLFAKFGVAFRYGKIKNKNVSFNSASTPQTTYLSQSSDMSFPSAIIGVGLEYWIWNRLSINAQYLYLPASVGSTTDLAGFDHFRFPQTNIVTVGVSFPFQ